MDSLENDRFLNREISWLEYNGRVLDEGLNRDTPLLERIRYLSIFAANLDEFFMVRIAGLKKMNQEGFVRCESPDNLLITQVLKEIRQRTIELLNQQYDCLRNELMPALLQHRISIVSFHDLSRAQKKQMTDLFRERVFPVLTPLAVDSSHPFPFLTNLTIYLIVEFAVEEELTENLFGFVEIPSVLPRLIPVETGSDGHHFLLLDDLIKAHLSYLFLGFEIKYCTTIRVTRNLEYYLMEDSVVDLLESVQKEMLNREHQEAARLEICGALSGPILQALLQQLHLEETDVFFLPMMLHLPDLEALYKLPFDDLKHPPFNPRIPARLDGKTNIFQNIRQKDFLVHHPYESFYVVSHFLSEAVSDPAVVGIKQTLYRTSGDSIIIDLLIKAAENGKHVTAVVELKARFDERSNIVWARRLERAGVNVVYGFVGLKTHCKACLVIRREKGRMVRYVHLSTGNYNAQTAKSYTDLGFFTANDDIGEDVSALFNLLTGFNTFGKKRVKGGVERQPTFKKLLLAPLNLRDRLLAEINQVKTSHQQVGGGLIIAKINGLMDGELIEELYSASQAGVEIKLLVRGICSLRPQVPGLSETIEVVSIVDRFLEHSRVYYFKTPNTSNLFLASADWMSRNLDRRIEIAYPVEDEATKRRLIQEILAIYWADNVKARILGPDGRYTIRRSKEGEERVRAQQKFIQLARAGGIKSIPYETAIRTGRFKGNLSHRERS